MFRVFLSVTWVDGGLILTCRMRLQRTEPLLLHVVPGPLLSARGSQKLDLSKIEVKNLQQAN